MWGISPICRKGGCVFSPRFPSAASPPVYVMRVWIWIMQADGRFWWMERCEQLDVTVQSVSCLRARKVLMNTVCGNLSALIQLGATMLMVLIRGVALNAMWQESSRERQRARAVFILSTKLQRKIFNYYFFLSVIRDKKCTSTTPTTLIKHIVDEKLILKKRSFSFKIKMCARIYAFLNNEYTMAGSIILLKEATSTRECHLKMMSKLMST